MINLDKRNDMLIIFLFLFIMIIFVINIIKNISFIYKLLIIGILLVLPVMIITRHRTSLKVFSIEIRPDNADIMIEILADVLSNLEIKYALIFGKIFNNSNEKFYLLVPSSYTDYITSKFPNNMIKELNIKGKKIELFE